ncbi:hypothetical protein [Leifsonia sp. NPDC058248]|uniref:hypothetical protein n=1 Tax=Leifsonia sp. NPDC058248 TaxID=3346402 RepID=UPI0036DD2118
MISPSTLRLLSRATGPSAITEWTWLVTAPFALTVMSGMQYVEITEPAGAIWMVAALGHVGVGILMLIAYFLIKPFRGAFRAPAVVTVFAAIGLVRPFLFLASAAILGYSVQVGDLGSRIAINVVVCVAGFSLIAISVDLVREHFGVLRRLRAVQRAAQADGENGRRRIETLRERAVDEVLARIDETVRPAIRPGLPASEASKLLRSIANDIVRPVSHDLFDSADDPTAATDAAELPRPRMRDWLAAALTGLQPAPAGLTAALFVALVIPYALGTYGPAVTAVHSVVGGALLYAGNRAVSALARRASGAAATIVIIVGYAVTGVVVALESTVLLAGLGLTTERLWFQAALYPVIACAVALVGSLSTRLGEDARELEESLQTSVATAARVRAAYDHERTGLASLLHSGVQADLIATALALSAGDDADAERTVREAVERVRTELEREHRDDPAPREQLARLVDSWSSAMPLEATIDDHVWGRLDDAVRCQVVVDAVSEGLANAVRHGDGSPVGLAIRPSIRDGVTVIVNSGGRLLRARPGIGLRDLSRHSEVILRERPGGVELAVSVP